MKITKISSLILTFSICLVLKVNAQTPQSINYQAVVRDQNGAPLVNKVVSFRLAILSGSSTGAPQYIETHNTTTNSNGLVTLGIGLGNPTTGSFSAVNWSTASKFLRVEVDINGGTNYSALGTTQFLSVPYALYAASSGNSSGWLPNGNTITTNQYLGTNNLDDLRFYTSGTQKMVLKTNGFIGLGTNNPEFRFQIEDNIGLETPGVDNGSTLFQLHNTSSTYYATTNMRIRTGNSPNFTMLAHYGPTYTQYTGFADYGLLLSTGSGLMLQAGSGNIRFMTGLTPVPVGIFDRMIITLEGNVGIGTTTPKTKLEVTSGDVYVNDATKGVILKSPNGNCWRMTVSNSGQTVVTAINCPN